MIEHKRTIYCVQKQNLQGPFLKVKGNKIPRHKVENKSQMREEAVKSNNLRRNTSN